MAPVSGWAGGAMARLGTQCQELAAAPGTPLAPPKLQGAGEVLLGEPQGPLAMPGMVMQVWGWRPPAQPLNSQHRCVAWGPQGTKAPWHQGPQILLSTSSLAQGSRPAPCGAQAPTSASNRARHGTSLAPHGKSYVIGVGGAEGECRGRVGTGRMRRSPPCTP